MRAFLAVPLPPSPMYGEVTQAITAAHPRARPVPPGSWHATLRFLGEIPEPTAIIEALAPVVARHPAGPLGVQGVGAFPTAARARVLWAGVKAQGLERLAADVAAVTPSPAAERPFHAHATLARLDPPQDVRQLIAAHAATMFAAGRLTEVVLFRSQLTPGGPVYSPLANFPLASPA